ncbi:hypothetical protein QAD02_015703 [Eretmocerus hayati]|uniref:Uncharacterized protein n=1 Tax=Eretmocerus hayati TaxID=131215 RepID=A0ACC2PAN9_9HYME|nr:hypothetical protein QAD02_015703 [Eretmocerus hayati]
MSLRKFMHKRNKYREEPNFKQLAIIDPDFRKIAITDLSGRVRINFKDQESLRILTKTLLKHDFNLQVDIPSNNLVPALPLRLNYILWVEDLLKHCNINDLSSVTGIDIGTGAVCIYPLLFSKINKSKMIGTDIDPESIKSAEENVQRNVLQDLIKVILVERDSILEKAFEEQGEFTFVMCNPPFFKTDQGLGKKLKQEPPRNASTGNEGELEVKGGEREFIICLIDESLKYQERVKIYTTMFGQKSTLAFLRAELAKRDILNTTWTEFCQGYTKRWGIAWTFIPKDAVDLSTAPVMRTRAEMQKMKKDRSMEIVFPVREGLKTLDELSTALKKWISELQIQMKEIEFDDDDQACWAAQLIGHKDTWSHSRRKRRQAIRAEAIKKQKLENSESHDEIETLTADPEPLEKTSTPIQNSDPLLVCTLIAGEKNDNDDRDESGTSSDEESNEEKMLGICLLFESGHGGKLSLETLRQYLVNKLDIREFFHKQRASKPNRKKRKRGKKNS